MGLLRRVADTLNRYDGLIMAVLTVVIVVVSWLGVSAARDAAQASKEQVDVQVQPFLTEPTRAVVPFTYRDGTRRLPKDFSSMFDLHVQAGQIYASIAIMNRGPGFAVIKGWRFGQPGDPALFKRPTSGQLAGGTIALVPRGESVRLGAHPTIAGPYRLARQRLADAVKVGDQVVFQVFYTDLALRRHFVSTFVARRRPGARYWGETASDFTTSWKDFQK